MFQIKLENYQIFYKKGSYHFCSTSNTKRDNLETNIAVMNERGIDTLVRYLGKQCR